MITFLDLLEASIRANLYARLCSKTAANLFPSKPSFSQQILEFSFALSYRYAYIHIFHCFFPELCTYEENIKIRDADNKLIELWDMRKYLKNTTQNKKLQL